MTRAPFFGVGYCIREPRAKKRVKGTTGLPRRLDFGAGGAGWEGRPQSPCARKSDKHLEEDQETRKRPILGSLYCPKP